MIGAEGFHILCGVLKEYSGNDADVRIPASVWKVGSWCFKDKCAMTGVTIPVGVREIGEYAFSGCGNLKRVVIPYGVTYIGDGAFSGCTSLEEVIIPDTVTRIGKRVFEMCERLTAFHLPSGLDHIPDGMFKGCRSLQDENGYVVVDGVLFDYFGKGDRVVIPDGVRVISSGVFMLNDDVVSITIPDSVIEIGRRAFAHCKSIREYIFPHHPMVIDGTAFENSLGTMDIRFAGEIDGFEDAAFECVWEAFGRSNAIHDICCVVLDKYPEIAKSSIIVKASITRRVAKILRLLLSTHRMEAASVLLGLYDYDKRDTLIEDMLSYFRDNVAVRAFLLDYKHRFFSPEVIRRLDDERIERAINLGNGENSHRSIIGFSAVEVDGGMVIYMHIHSPFMESSKDSMLGDCTTYDVPEMIDGKRVIGILNSTFGFFSETTFINIPDSVVAIEKGTLGFGGHSVVVRASRDSYAHKYAVKNDIHFIECME